MASAAKATDQLVAKANPTELIEIKPPEFDQKSIQFYDACIDLIRSNFKWVQLDVVDKRSKVTIIDRNVFFDFTPKQNITASTGGWPEILPNDVDILDRRKHFFEKGAEKTTDKWVLFETFKTVKYMEKQEGKRKFTENVTSWKYFVWEKSVTKDQLKIEPMDKEPVEGKKEEDDVIEAPGGVKSEPKNSDKESPEGLKGWEGT